MDEQGQVSVSRSAELLPLSNIRLCRLCGCPFATYIGVIRASAPISDLIPGKPAVGSDLR